MKIISLIYLYTIQQIFNIVFNIFWLFKIVFSGKLKQTLTAKRTLKYNAKDIDHIKIIISDFKYKYDGIFKAGIFKKWPTWTSSILVLVYRELNGNCQDAAYLTRWLCKQYNKGLDAGRKIEYKNYIIVPCQLNNLDKVHFITGVKYYDAEYVFSNYVSYRMKPIDYIRGYASRQFDNKKYIVI